MLTCERGSHAATTTVQRPANRARHLHGQFQNGVAEAGWPRVQRSADYLAQSNRGRSPTTNR
jgi:hypothetical protein